MAMLCQNMHMKAMAQCHMAILCQNMHMKAMAPEESWARSSVIKIMNLLTIILIWTLPLQMISVATDPLHFPIKSNP